MLFIFFWKQTTVKIWAYKLASVSYSCFYIPYSEKRSNDSNICISIWFWNIFSKSKTNTDEDKKKNFTMEIVKQSLFFAASQYAVLKFTYHWYFANVQ